ncbi:YeaH/YhbH family protein [Halomonas sp. 18H]|nr:YeaH/YhbH family protein [Halomonas sp. 18H]MCW4152587.1 YeaH/YhbH family protein [Halomonas sp. 18H]
MTRLQNKPRQVGLASVLALTVGLATSGAAQAANCTTGAKAAADIWKEYDNVAKVVGCSAGTAGAAILSAGATLPQSAQIYKKCFEQADKVDESSRKMIAQWNKLMDNGWGKIGPRELRIGSSYEGNIKSQLTRMFISSSPIADPFVKLRIRKRDERANKGKTRVTVCKYPPGGPGHGVDGEKVWSFTIDPGRQNQGKVWERAFAIPGHVLTVAFKGQSAVKAMKYRLDTERVRADHTVLVASSDVPGSTGYDLSVSDYLEPIAGTIAGYDASVDANDRYSRNGARGTVGSGNDAYRVVGQVNDVRLNDPSGARVLIDGRPQGSGGGRDAGSGSDDQVRQPDHRVVIDGGQHRGATDYTLIVSGRLEGHEGRMDDFDVGLGSNDQVRGNRAQGRVSSGADGYRVYGTIQDILVDDPDSATVYVDGRERPVTERVGSGGDTGGASRAADKSRFAGTWTSSFGELRLHKIGSFLIGDYADEGVIVAKVTDGCAAGVFTNGGRNGVFRWQATGNGAFDGRWGWRGQGLGKSWSGQRTGPAPDRLTNFTRGSGSTQSIEQDRTVFDGRYSSNFGPVTLVSQDLFLVGDYADKGVMAGMWDGDSFVGRFTNGDRTGWFDLAFYSKNGEFRDGQWGWVGQNSGGTWTLSDNEGDATPNLGSIPTSFTCN